MRVLKACAVVCFPLLSLGATAQAETPVPVTPTPAVTTPTTSFEIIEAKVTSGIADKEAVDNKLTFTTGEKAYLWMKVKPAGDGATLRIRYSKDGTEVWTMDPVAARLGRLWYYKTLRAPGQWKAEIIDASDTVKKELTFTVTGEPVSATAAAPAEAPATKTVAAPAKTTAVATVKTAPTPNTAPRESAHVAVVEGQLATEIKDRQPVAPGMAFKQGDKVFAWFKLDVKDATTQVRLRWRLADKEVFTSEPINVKQSPTWRTWRYKTVDLAGAWKVELLDAEDKTVHEIAFNVN